MNDQITTVINSGAQRFLSSLHLRGYQYCGLHGPNHIPGPPKNKLDQLCKFHDEDYNRLLRSGRNPYQRYTPADDRLVDRVTNYLASSEASSEEKVLGQVVLEFFSFKKFALPPLLDMGIAHGTTEDQLLQEMQWNTNVVKREGDSDKELPRTKISKYEPPINPFANDDDYDPWQGGGWGDDDDYSDLPSNEIPPSRRYPQKLNINQRLYGKKTKGYKKSAKRKRKPKKSFARNIRYKRY